MDSTITTDELNDFAFLIENNQSPKNSLNRIDNTNYQHILALLNYLIKNDLTEHVFALLFFNHRLHTGGLTYYDVIARRTCVLNYLEPHFSKTDRTQLIAIFNQLPQSNDLTNRVGQQQDSDYLAIMARYLPSNIGYTLDINLSGNCKQDYIFINDVCNALIYGNLSDLLDRMNSINKTIKPTNPWHEIKKEIQSGHLDQITTSDTTEIKTYILKIIENIKKDIPNKDTQEKILLNLHEANLNKNDSNSLSKNNQMYNQTDNLENSQNENTLINNTKDDVIQDLALSNDHQIGIKICVAHPNAQETSFYLLQNLLLVKHYLYSHIPDSEKSYQPSRGIIKSKENLNTFDLMDQSHTISNPSKQQNKEQEKKFSSKPNFKNSEIKNDDINDINSDILTSDNEISLSEIEQVAEQPDDISPPKKRFLSGIFDRLLSKKKQTNAVVEIQIAESNQPKTRAPQNPKNHITTIVDYYVKEDIAESDLDKNTLTYKTYNSTAGVMINLHYENELPTPKGAGFH